MQTAIATLRMLPETKEQKVTFVNMLINEALSGYADPIRLAGMLKMLQDIAEEVRKNPDVAELIISEMDKYGKGSQTASGFKFQIKSRSNYDLPKCGDPVWDELKEKITAREKFLKAMTSEVVDPDTGVCIQPPPKKTSTYYEINHSE